MIAREAPAGLRLRAPWRELTPEEVARVPAQLGVFEVALHDGPTVFIGYAGGRSAFGLRGEIERLRRTHPDQRLLFRHEVNMQYLSRWRELLMVHVADTGSLPRWQPPEDARGLGSLARPTAENRGTHDGP